MDENVALTYDEMLACAKRIHPDACVTNGETRSTWTIIIPTDVPVYEILDAKFKGTIAWDLYKESDKGFGNQLLRWAVATDNGHLCLEAVAESRNLMQTNQGLYKSLYATAIHAEFGDGFDLGAANDAQLAVLGKLSRKMQQVADMMIAASLRNFNEKWDNHHH